MNYLLQYLWIEKYKNIEKQGFNFTSRASIHFDYETKNLSIEKNENYCENFFGNNIELSCIVGKNGSGKTTLLELIMHIMDGKSISTNCILAIYIDNSLIVYHTGIIRDEYNLFTKFQINKKGEYNLDLTNIPDIIYYTYAFNYNQFNQKYKNIHNYSTAFLFNNNTESKLCEQGDIISLTDINKYNYNTIKNQLDFIIRYKDFFEKFGISKISKININIQNNRKNALVDLANKYNENILDIKNQSNHFSKHFPDKNNHYQDQINRLNNQPLKIEIHETCEKFLSFKTDNKLEIIFNNIAIELMNNFVNEMLEYNKVILLYPMSFDDLLNFFNYLHKILCLEEKDKNIKYPFLNRILTFFKNFTLFTRLTPPKNDEELWHFWNIDKYIDFTEYLFEFLERYNKCCFYDSDFQFSISINNYTEDINPIRFFEEYYKIGKVYDFLSFSYSLSSGEMSLLNVFSSLFKIINSKFNPYKNEQKMDNFIIIIDEADMLLHPDWQKKYINSLISFLNSFTTTFTMQLLIATHSPIMLSDIPKQNVLFLKNENGIREAEGCNTFASNIFQLFREGFFIGDTGIGVYAEQKLKEIVDHIHNNDIDDNELRKLINSVGDTFLRNKLNEEYLIYHSHENDTEEKQSERIIVLENQLIKANVRLNETNIKHRDDLLELQKILNHNNESDKYPERNNAERSEINPEEAQAIIKELNSYISALLAEKVENDKNKN